jgi:hypothetical protein
MQLRGGSLPVLQDFASSLAVAEPPKPGERAPLPFAQQPLWFLSMNSHEA